MAGPGSRMRIPPMGERMIVGASEQPLIPQPPPRSPCCGKPWAKIAAAAVPAFTRELDQAADQARQGSDPAPLRRFVTQWAVYVQIQRHLRLAARLRKLEDVVAEGDGIQEVREAAAEIGRILDAAHVALTATSA